MYCKIVRWRLTMSAVQEGPCDATPFEGPVRTSMSPACYM